MSTRTKAVLAALKAKIEKAPGEQLSAEVTSTFKCVMESITCKPYDELVVMQVVPVQSRSYSQESNSALRAVVNKAQAIATLEQMIKV